MWILWWSKWHWDRFFPRSSVLPSQFYSNMTFHTDISSGRWIIGSLVAAVERHCLTPLTWTITSFLLYPQRKQVMSREWWELFTRRIIEGVQCLAPWALDAGTLVSGLQYHSRHWCVSALIVCSCRICWLMVSVTGWYRTEHRMHWGCFLICCVFQSEF
jgi:hypothetical protein